LFVLSQTLPVGQSEFERQPTQTPLLHFGAADGQFESEVHPLEAGLLKIINIIMTATTIKIAIIIKITGIQALDFGSSTTL